MRIDYSEPKKSYVSNQGGSRPPRRESAGLFSTVLVVTALVTFVAGFGTGWYFSQKAAKKSFQAATEQNSLENAKKEAAAPPKPAPPTPVPPQQPEQAATTPAAPTPPGEVPLSFFKSLPSGQKGAALGSGINSKEEGAKGPLQAPVPAGAAKPAADPTKTADKAGTDKAAKPAEANGYTVQVASYPLRSEAETLKNTLSGKGYSVYISESHLGDKGTWYRVRVGRRLEQDAAKDLAKKLGKSAQVFPDKE